MTPDTERPPFVLRTLSVSQAEKFDQHQNGGCPRRWWFETVQGLKPEQSDAQSDGDLGHALLARYLSTGAWPEGRVRMGKAVTAAIAKGVLPAPGPDLLIERRFSGQPQRDADGKWIPLDPTLTPIRIGGLPWDGFIDVMHRRDGAVTVIDHKFSSDIHAEWSKRADQLIRTVQMPVYALVGLALFPDATEFILAHHNVSRRGIDSDFRPARVTLDQVREREADIAVVVDQMKWVATAEKQDDIPFNRKACSAYNGCPFQNRCTAFKERKVALTPDEQALFDGLDDVFPADGAKSEKKSDQIPDSELVPAGTPENDPGLPEPKPGKSKVKIVDVPAGAVEVRDCVQGKEYLVDGQVVTFVTLTSFGGKSLGSFKLAAGGPPVLKPIDEWVMPAPEQPKEKKPRGKKAAEGEEKKGEPVAVEQPKVAQHDPADAPREAATATPAPHPSMSTVSGQLVSTTPTLPPASGDLTLAKSVVLELLMLPRNSTAELPMHLQNSVRSLFGVG